MSIYQPYMENQTNILSIKRVIEYLVCVRTLEPPCIEKPKYIIINRAETNILNVTKETFLSEEYSNIRSFVPMSKH